MAVQNFYVEPNYWVAGYAQGEEYVYPFTEAQSIAPSALIELFELQLNTTQHGTNDIYRFHAGTNLVNNGEVIWNGNNYMRFPIEAEGFEYSGKGTLPRPLIRCSNLLGTITAILASLPSGLEGAKVTRIRTLARYLDNANFPGNANPYGFPDPTAYWTEIYYVDRKVAETRDVVEFELAAAFDLAGVRAPKRQCISNICQWAYRSSECSYAGNLYFDANGNSVNTLAQDVCGKRLSDCSLRFGSITQLGAVTSGSSSLVLDAATSAQIGMPVTGFGVPASTTITNISGLTLTMSANATASTTTTKTGTVQTNRTQIVLNNTTGLSAGMLVSGPYVTAGTTIASIAGNTITLGQPVDLIYVLTVAATRTTSLQWVGLSPTVPSNTTETLTTTGLSVGMYVAGPTIPLSANATITSITATPTGRLVFSYSASILNSSGTYTFYSLQTPSAQTYTFTASNRTYTFKVESELPFGSYPGIGTYFT